MTNGILALWNDCRPGDEAIYEAWYKEEHLPERLGIPGFRRGRRYLSTCSGPAYFTYYEVETPETLTSAVYRDRLDSPTPRTRRMMAETFQNMSRTICEVTERAGRFRGAWAVTVSTTVLPAQQSPCVEAWAALPGVARAELWHAAGNAEPSEEERLRGGDDAIAACAFIEVFDQATAERFALSMVQDLGWDAAVTGTYRLVCELET